MQTGVSRLQHILSTLVQNCPKPEADVSVFLKSRILFYLFKKFFLSFTFGCSVSVLLCMGFLWLQ